MYRSFEAIVVLLHGRSCLRSIGVYKEIGYKNWFMEEAFRRSQLYEDEGPTWTDVEKQYLLGLVERHGTLDHEAWLRSMFSELPQRGYQLKGVQYYNPFRKRMRHMLHWRRAVEAKRDAAMVFQAASEGRPLELAKRLRLGKLAGGHTFAGSIPATDSANDADPDEKLRASDGWNALTAACAGGHGDCVWALADGLQNADLYLRGRDHGGRACWEVARDGAIEALDAVRREPWMLCEDLPTVIGHNDNWEGTAPRATRAAPRKDPDPVPDADPCPYPSNSSDPAIAATSQGCAVCCVS